MDWNALKPLLDEKLDKRHVKEPSGSFGPKGDYLEGWHVINEANRIFGYGGWSYTIDMRQDDLRTAPDKYGKDQWQAAYTCICTLTVDGVIRQDVGFGSGFAKTVGDAIEGATKEAATDALKRALRSFGNQFGLALYDKARTNVETPQAKPPAIVTTEQALELAQLIEDVGGDAAKTCNHFSVARLDQLPADKFDALKAKLLAAKKGASA